MKNSLIIVCALMTSACGTMSKKECANSDWEHVGLIDGRMGKTESYINEHRNTCGTNVPAASAYEAGRRRGIKDYCTPRSAYFEGANGRIMSDVCPEEKMAKLSKHFDEGRLTYELKVERDGAKRDLEQKRERIAKDKSVVGDIGKAFRLISGTSATQSEEERVENLNGKLYERSAVAPPGKAPVPSLQQRIEADPIPAARNLGAIAAGSIFGFGIGHSINGTYREQGWRWTVIDGLNIAGLVVNSANCTTGPVDPMTGARAAKNTGICAATTLSLAMGLIVSRVWQGIEIGRSSAHTYSPYQVAIVPGDDGGNLLATWIW